jgi:hypothetical protein
MKREVGGDRLTGSKELPSGDVQPLIGLYDLVTARLWRGECVAGEFEKLVVIVKVYWDEIPGH